jgi:hypothetical protein
MTFRRCIELILCLVVAVGSARAEDGFKTHYEAGLSHYSSEEYDAAIKEFEAAYAIKPRPRLLFNIGQAHRNLGNARAALHYYLLYQALENAPKPGLKSELEGYIAQMKSIVDQAERARRAEDHDVDEPAVSPPPPPPPPPPATTAALTFTPAPPPKPVYRRAWFWGVVGGAAAVVLVTGLAVGLTVNQSPSYDGDIRHPMF